jgi:hypothetical protein
MMGAMRMSWLGLALLSACSSCSGSQPNSDVAASDASDASASDARVSCRTQHLEGDEGDPSATLTTPHFVGECLEEIEVKRREDGDPDPVLPDDIAEVKHLRLRSLEPNKPTLFAKASPELDMAPRQLAASLLKAAKLESYTKDWAKICLREEKQDGTRTILRYDALDIIYLTPPNATLEGFRIEVDSQTRTVDVIRSHRSQSVCEE